MIRAGIIALVLSAPAVAAAQTEAEAAAINMELAVDLCLQELSDQDGFREGLIPRFAAAGFTVYQNEGWSEVTAPGVFAFLSPGEADGFCTVQAPDVPMAAAAQIAQDRVNYRFPGGAPNPAAQENRAGCPMLRYTALGAVHRIAVWSAGNGGGCEDSNSSALLFGGGF